MSCGLRCSAFSAVDDTTSKYSRAYGSQTGYEKDADHVPCPTTVDWLEVLEEAGVCSLRFEVLMKNLTIELIKRDSQCGGTEVGAGRVSRSCDVKYERSASPYQQGSRDSVKKPRDPEKRRGGLRRQSEVVRNDGREERIRDGGESFLLLHAKTMTVGRVAASFCRRLTEEIEHLAQRLCIRILPALYPRSHQILQRACRLVVAGTRKYSQRLRYIEAHRIFVSPEPALKVQGLLVSAPVRRKLPRPFMNDIYLFGGLECVHILRKSVQ